MIKIQAKRFILFFLAGTSFLLTGAQVNNSATPKSDTLRLFSIGNSHTWDTRPKDDFRKIGESMHIVIENGWHINCGKNLGHIWNNPTETCIDLTPYGNFLDAIEHYQWDAISIQPFIGNSASEELQAILSFLEWMDSTVNENTDKYLYFTWPKNTSDSLVLFNYSEAWLSRFDSSDTQWIENKAYFDYLSRFIKIDYPQIKIIPVGEIIYEFDQEAINGNIPGFRSAAELYRDAWHMNNVGKYIAGLTFFCVVNRIDPMNVPDFDGYHESKNWPCDRELTWDQKLIFRKLIAKNLNYIRN